MTTWKIRNYEDSEADTLVLLSENYLIKLIFQYVVILHKPVILITFYWTYKSKFCNKAFQIRKIIVQII